MTSRTSAGTTSLSLTLLAASLANAIVMLDATVVNVAMERIKASLGTDVTGLQWVMSAYTLVFASFLLTGGIIKASACKTYPLADADAAHTVPEAGASAGAILLRP